MSDFISREKVLKLVSESGKFSLMAMIADPEIIPSADVRENIHGEWIKNFLGIDICSKCGEPMRDRRVNHINFCNCCGADMRGKANEQT